MSPLHLATRCSPSPCPSDPAGPPALALGTPRSRVLVTLVAVGIGASCTAVEQDTTTEQFVYFGTGASHVYVATFDDTTGELGEPSEAAAIGRPGFLEFHPSKDVLYAVGREREGDSGWRGEAAAFQVDPATGSLNEMNRSATNGAGAAHVAVHPAGTAIAACNYGDGNTVTLGLEPDGSLGSVVSDVAHEGSSIHPTRQGEPHPHSVNFSPDGEHLIVPDLGTDELVTYKFRAESAAIERVPDPQVRVAPGSGPRHMTFHPNGRWAYVINELASTVAVFQYDASSGGINELQVISTLPEDYDGPANTTAEVLVHPNGQFLYGSNRGSNTIAVFSIDQSDGKLAAVERVPTGGDWPRNFRLSPSGSFLLAANQRSDSVHVLRVDPDSGRLAPTGGGVSVPSPMCVRFGPAR